jgi:hypothetical protein
MPSVDPTGSSFRFGSFIELGKASGVSRLRDAPPDNLQVLLSHSRAHHAPYPQIHLRIVRQIVEIREQPPENRKLTPGPRAILYYLHRDQELLAHGISLPRSTRTIWHVLRKLGYILDTPHRHRRLASAS